MPTRRGTTNRLTGKTTPRTKPTTHWGTKGRRAATSKKTVKSGASSPSTAKK